VNRKQLLVGPLGPFGPEEDTHVLVRPEGRWLVSERSAHSPLRLSDANPSGKVAAWARPDSVFAEQLGVAAGSSEVFADGLLVASVAPGEWLALTPGDAASLTEMLGGLADPADPPVLVDRSSGLAAFRLSGAAATTLLAGCCDAVPHDGLPDAAVCVAPVAGLRCTIVRDDLLAGELVPGVTEPLDGTDAAGAGPVSSYLLVCDRSAAPLLSARLLEAGTAHGIEPEGFAGYRAYHRDM